MDRRKRSLVLVVCALMVGQLGETLYLPSLPHLQEVFDCSAQATQALLGLFLTGFGLSAFVFGAWAEQRGRRPVLLRATAGFTLAALAASLSTSILALQLAFLGMGMCAGAYGVLVRVVPRDLLRGPELYRAFSKISAFTVVMPLLAPVAGAWVLAWWGWRALFAVFVLMGTLLGAVLFWGFEETHPHLPETPEPIFSSMQPQYLRLIKERYFMAYTLCSTVNLGLLMTYETIAPFVFQDHFGFSITQYAWVMVWVALSFFVGAWHANPCAERWGVRPTLLVVHLILVLVGALAWCDQAWFSLNWMFLMAILTLFFALSGLIFSLSLAAAQEEQTGHAGYSGAMLSGLQNLGAGFVLFGISGYFAPSVPLLLGLLCFGPLLGAGFLMWVPKRSSNETS